MGSCDGKPVNVNEVDSEVGPSECLNRKPTGWICDKIHTVDQIVPSLLSSDAIPLEDQRKTKNALKSPPNSETTFEVRRENKTAAIQKCEYS